MPKQSVKCFKEVYARKIFLMKESTDFNVAESEFGDEAEWRYWIWFSLTDKADHYAAVVKKWW